MQRPTRMTAKAALVSLLIAPLTPADEVRLADGRVVYGAVERPDDERIVVRTDEGILRLRSHEVLRVRTDAELEAELDRLEQSAQGAGHAHLELARLAQRYHLNERMWRHLEVADGSLPVVGSRRDRLDATLASLGDDLLPRLHRSASPREQARILLRNVRRYKKPVERAAAREVIAGLEAQAVGTEEDAITELLRERARQASLSAERQLALNALQAREAPGAPEFVWRTTIVDRDPKLRHRVVEATRARGEADQATAHLARGLQHGHPEVIVRTAHALAGLGSPAALEPLLAAGPHAARLADLPGGSTRGHVSFTRQQAYIRDFDVEVAQAAFIADPKVDVIQSGVVLDATVHSVISERVRVVRVIRSAIRGLTGEDPGKDPATWTGWRPAPRESATVADRRD